MSKQVDQRVVEMRFDNAQFEKNVSTSMSTLDKLKKSLNLEGASKGLENINYAAKNVDVSSLSNGVETVRAKFSALEVMAVTALANITNSVVNTGKRMVSALTVEPIKAGFQEYETQMNAVQTILANTQKEGTNVKTVNKALDELNTYADKTIYNFTEMTRNIGTFTAAGVKLDTSVSSIKGIANLAAVSGSTSQQASTAMYQLSQAIASGTVKLMDWNSVVNAGMGGQVFQDALIRTSEHLKTGAKAAVAAKGSFRESLSTGWLTTEVLTQTLDQFSTAADTQEEYEAAIQKFVNQGYSQEQAKQMADMAKTAGEAATKVKTFTQLIDTLKEALGSGWTTSWRLIIGDFEEAKALWTDVSDYFSDAINKSSEARNKMLEGWAEGDGRTKMIESFKDAFNGLLNIVKPIKEAFREVFPPTTADQLLKITERIRDMSAKFRELTERNAPQLKSTFKGIFSVIKIGVTVIKAIVSGITKLIGKITGLSGGVLGVTGALGNWISKIASSITSANLFGKAINGIVDFLGKVIDKLKEFGSFVKGKFEAPGFEAFLNILNKLWTGIKKVGLAVVKVASNIGKALGNAFQSGDMKSLLDIVNGGIITAILLKLKNLISGLKNFSNTGKSIKDAIKGIFDTVGGALEAWQNNIKAGTLKKIAVSIGILAAALWVISGIDQNKLGSALAAITTLFIELIGAMAAFNKLCEQTKGAGKSATLMIGMSIAVLILASALKKVSDLDWNGVGKRLTAIAGLLGMLTGAMIALSKFTDNSKKIFKINKDGLFSDKSQKNFIAIGLAMIAMAAAVKILASACSDLGSMSWDEIARGLTGIIGLMAVLTGAMIALSKFAGASKKLEVTKKGIFSSKSKNNFVSIGLAMIAMAAAMKILASAAKDFADLSWEGLAKAGAAITGILALVVGFNKLCDKVDGSMTKNAISLIILGAAMEIFANICQKFGNMSWPDLGKAAAAIIGILAVAVGFNKLCDKIKGSMTKNAASLIVLGVAMEIFANICKKFGSMSWPDLGKAGAAITGILAIVLAFNKLCDYVKGDMTKTAASLLVMAVALRVFAPALAMLGGMSVGAIAKGLISLAAGLGIFIAAAYLIDKLHLSKALYSLSGAIALFGIGCLAAGAGILAFAVGMGMLAGVTAAGAAAIVAALHIIIIGILELIPSMIGVLTEAVVALCQVFIQSIPAICEAIRVLVVELVKVLVECIPVLADGALKMVVGVLEALVAYTPQIVDLVFQFLIAVLDGIAKNLPALIQSVVNVFKALFSGVIDALNSMDPEMLVKGILGIGFMVAMMAALAGMAALAPAAMIGVLGFGAVITELAGVLAVLGGLAQIPGLEWLISEGGDFLQKIGTAIGQFIGGIVGGIAEGVTSTLPQVGTNLSEFMTNIKPFIEGARMIDASTFEGVEALTKIILALTAANILEGLTSWFTGGSSLTKFGEEIAAFAPSIKSYADTVKGIDASAVEASVNAAKCLSELADNLPNSGGLVSWFAGENDIGTFGEQLIPFGKGMKAYSDSISGFNAEAVTASANAAQAIADMTTHIPNQGGMVAWFTGDNSVANFAFDLVKLGDGLKAYSNSISGFNAEAVTASANAAQAIADMTTHIPNQGGMVAWFTGDNSIAKFASQLPILGAGLLSFSISVAGINAENIIAATSAAKALAEMSAVIPNEGGMVAWFTGENSIANFASQLPLLGAGLLSFSISVAGINAENVTAAADAAKKLAEIANTVPNVGGMAQWFSGESGVVQFASQLPILGAGLLSFSISVAGINAENIIAASDAAKKLAEMANTVPNINGITAWFSGESGVVQFASQLPLLGSGLLSFSNSVSGINAENVTAAANAAKKLAEMVKIVPTEGGLKAWFSGESGVVKFANNLPTLGKGLKGFSESVKGINPENVTAASNAAKKLAEMSSVLPKNIDRIDDFGSKLQTLGTNLKGYFNTTKGISKDAISASTKATKAITDFSSKVNPDKLKSASEAIKKMTDALKNASKVKAGSTDGFSKALSNVAKNSADSIIKTFKGMYSKINNSGKTLIDQFVKGMKSKKSVVDNGAKDLVSKAASAIKAKGQKDKFENAGKYLGAGLVEGIKAKYQAAYDAGYGLGQKAVQGEKDGQKSNSPSKLTIQAGKWLGEGLVVGMEKMGNSVYKSGQGLGKLATDTLSSTISRISDVVNSDIDAQPTIRPVLDLSDVTAGAGVINGMFGTNPSIGVLARVNSISSMMNHNQNGSDREIISAIKDLGQKIEGSSGDTYNFGDISYDGESDVSVAVKTLARAIQIDRRT